MRSRFIALLLITAMAAALFCGCKTAEKEDGQDAKNAIRVSAQTVPTISAGNGITAAVLEDGSVIDTYGCSGHEYNWEGENIIAVAVQRNYILGLKKDGTVIAQLFSQGLWEDKGQCDVSSWNDITAIAAGRDFSVGLTKDGKVVYAGSDEEMAREIGSWENISAISAKASHVLGLRKDGTVAAAGSNGLGQCNVSGWTNIKAIAAGFYHSVGLKLDGTVVVNEYTGVTREEYDNASPAERNNMDCRDFGQFEVGDWKDIVAIAAGWYHTVGLRSDGTVVAVGAPLVCDVMYWTDIIAIDAGWSHTIGLKADGTLVAIGFGTSQTGINIGSWKNIKIPGKDK